MNINSRTPLNVNVWFPNQIHIIFHSVFSGLEITLHKFVCWFTFFQHFLLACALPKKSFYFIPRAFTKTYDLSTWKQFSSSPHNDWIMDFPSSKIWRLIKKNESFFIECHRCVLLLSCADFLFNTSNSSRPFFASKLIMSVVILKQRLVSTARCINKRGCKSNVGATLPSKIPILAPKSKNYRTPAP